MMASYSAKASETEPSSGARSPTESFSVREQYHGDGSKTRCVSRYARSSPYTMAAVIMP